MRQRADKHLFVAYADDVGASLVDFVAARLELQPDAAAALVKGGSVYLGERRERAPTTTLSAGQRVTIFVAPAQDSKATMAATRAERILVAYEDADAVVLDKPAGIASSATRAGGERTVEDFVRRTFGKAARLLHRLDRETSGLMLVSRRIASRTALARAIAEHRVERRYLARVGGLFGPDEQTLHGAVSVERGRARVSTDPRAALAETLVRVRERDADSQTTLLECQPLTGRTHQIRVQLAHAGHPIVGDVLYDGPAADRLALHAYALGWHDNRVVSARVPAVLALCGSIQ